MDIRIEKSKTDQLKRGASVRVVRQAENPQDCPVNITLIYLRMLDYPESCNGWLQPRVRHTSQGQRGDVTRRLSYTRFLQDLKDLIEATGRDSSFFREHSGRRGGATAAAEARAKWIDLKKLGRWASDAAPQLYVENTEKRRSELPLLLAQAAQNKDTSNIQERLCIVRPVAREPIREAAASHDRVSVTEGPLPIILPPCREPAAGPVVKLPSMQ